MNDNRNNPQQGQQEQRPLEKNETLQDAGASVPDYGRGGTQPDDLERKHGPESGREGNSSIPLDGEDTIGNP